jgi:hypothetical protein
MEQTCCDGGPPEYAEFANDQKIVACIGAREGLLLPSGLISGRYETTILNRRFCFSSQIFRQNT